MGSGSRGLAEIPWGQASRGQTPTSRPELRRWGLTPEFEARPLGPDPMNLRGQPLRRYDGVPEMLAIKILIACLVCFLIGGIPFGPIIARVKKVDLRKTGSGNIGATNVYRALGMKYAVLVFALDALKGSLCGYAGLLLFRAGMPAGLCGVAALLGHVFSPWLKFRGGKGVATGFGAMMVFAPIPSAISFALWAAIIGWKKVVSLASMAGAISLPAAVFVFNGIGWRFYTSLIIAGLVIWSHRENIVRLLRGEEQKIARTEKR